LSSLFPEGGLQGCLFHPSQAFEEGFDGHITKAELGCALICRDGNEFELKAQGWNAF